MYLTTGQNCSGTKKNKKQIKTKENEFFFKKMRAKNTRSTTNVETETRREKGKKKNCVG